MAAGTEVVAGDVLDPRSLDEALRGVHTAYYLIHSMGTSRDYAENDRRGAESFAKAARDAGVQRIVYLGALGQGERLSKHLASRQEVGRILRESGVPTVEFRASIVIGSGSLSFELVRALVEKLPAMVTPSWVDTPTQPIGIEDLVAYLMAALELPAGESVTYEIGGPDRVSYGDLMREYGRLRGLRRVMVRVPVLTPRLSSLWLALVSPLYASVGRELIDGVRNETVVHDDRALRDFTVRPRGIRDVLARALANEDLEFAATRWSDALSSQRAPRDWGGVDVRLAPGGLARGVGGRRAGGGVRADRPDRGQRGAGTTATGSGAGADCSTWPSAGRACAAAAETPNRSPSARRWTSGGWRRSSPGTCCGSLPRCGCRAARGCSSR